MNFFELPFVDIDISTASTTTLIAAVAGKKVRVYAFFFNAQGDQLLDLRDNGTGTNVLKQLALGTNGGLALGTGSLLIFKTANSKGLDLVTTNAVKTTGRIYYTQKDN